MRIRRLVEYPEYVVSDCGKVWNCVTGNQLKACISNSGYEQISAKGGKKVYIHKLVALAFVDKDYSKRLVIDHNDSNKLNNKACNLSWVTSSQNNYKAYACGERVSNVGESCGSSKLTKDEVITIRKLHADGWMLSEIHRQVINKTSPQNMGDIVKRRTWKHI